MLAPGVVLGSQLSAQANVGKNRGPPHAGHPQPPQPARAEVGSGGRHPLSASPPCLMRAEWPNVVTHTRGSFIFCVQDLLWISYSNT